MDIKTIKRLQGLSMQLHRSLPRALTVNGSGDLHQSGNPVEIMRVLVSIEQSIDLADDINDIVQGLKGRGQGKTD